MLFAALVIAAFVVAGCLWAFRPLRVPVTAAVPEEFPAGSFSHEAFESLLHRYTDANGRVDYAGWHASERPGVRHRAHLDPEIRSRRPPDRRPGDDRHRSRHRGCVLLRVDSRVPVQPPESVMPSQQDRVGHPVGPLQSTESGLAHMRAGGDKLSATVVEGGFAA